jgi:hypothetical protein
MSSGDLSFQTVEQSPVRHIEQSLHRVGMRDQFTGQGLPVALAVLLTSLLPGCYIQKVKRPETIWSQGASKTDEIMERWHTMPYAKSSRLDDIIIFLALLYQYV